MGCGWFPMITGNRAVWRSLGGLLLLLGVVTGSGYGLAEDSSEGFSATVRVDATADSAAAARELARIDGQRRALMIVIDRLSGSPDGAKLSKLDDKTITDMVESFEVANERMSAVHYLADYTFHFRPTKVRRLVHVADSAPPEANSKPGTPEGGGNRAVAEGEGKPLNVLPVYKDAGSTVLWEDPNAWRQAWAQRAAESGSARLIVPLGDASDLATIDAGRAEAGKPDALATIAQRNGGDEAIVALATAQHTGDDLVGLDVSVKRYRFGHLSDTHNTTLAADPGERADDFLARAAGTIAGEIPNG